MIPSFLLLLPACVAIDGDRILAGQLAESIPWFAAFPPDTLAGYTPQPGVRRYIGGSTLQRLAAQFGVPDDAAGDLCVERRVQPVPEEEMRAAMLKSLEATTAALEIVEASRLPAPAGRVEFPMSGLARAADTSNVAVWKGFVRYDGNRRFPIWARVKLAGSCTAMVASEDLPAGAAIRASQVREEAKVCFPGSTQGHVALSDVVGKTPRRLLKAGSPVSMASLARPLQVKRGESVTAEAREEGVLLKIDAVAETAGAIGDTIVVRNPSTGKRFAARVDAAGAVTALKTLEKAPRGGWR